MHYHAVPCASNLCFSQFHPHWFEPAKQGLSGWASCSERLKAWPNFADDESVRLRKWGEALWDPHIDSYWSGKNPLETDTRTELLCRNNSKFFSDAQKSPKEDQKALDLRSKSIPTSTDWCWD